MDVGRRGGTLTVTANPNDGTIWGGISDAEWSWPDTGDNTYSSYEETVAVFPGINEHPFIIGSEADERSTDPSLFGNLLICPREERGMIFVYYKILEDGQPTSTESYKVAINLNHLEDKDNFYEWEMNHKYEYHLKFIPKEINIGTEIYPYTIETEYYDIPDTQEWPKIKK